MGAEVEFKEIAKETAIKSSLKILEETLVSIRRSATYAVRLIAGPQPTPSASEGKRIQSSKVRLSQAYFQGQSASPAYYHAFLADWEGIEGITSNQANEMDQFLSEWEKEGNIEPLQGADSHFEHFITEFGPIDPHETMLHLNNPSVMHAVWKKRYLQNSKAREIIDRSNIS
ncbi:hypothetical protein BGT96224_Ac30377 [Blumeria graminis f. sp. tritici 96224]|uniref:Uncharacterized protein n=1 Tax=Blumeria graminis f. sp. tritici 96224 TaxID=1268274 RepID=A0A656KLI0_BLUGR|nr:hypothetical protein BGT96224_Ac30377 [Blumeria graminis f. sp. tritici 96224]